MRRFDMAAMNSAWIMRYLVQHTFQRKGLLIVPETYWSGSECDLLLVTENLRIIDIEIKVSRADFRRDKAKDKWYHAWDYGVDGPWRPDANGDRRRREFPRRVWKHYFAMPADIWKPEMVADLPSPACGVILLHKDERGGWVTVERKSKPNKDAEKISAESAIDLARLASLRMWDALIRLEDSKKSI
jgi:hypothetical protein